MFIIRNFLVCYKNVNAQSIHKSVKRTLMQDVQLKKIAQEGRTNGVNPPVNFIR